MRGRAAAGAVPADQYQVGGHSRPMPFPETLFEALLQDVFGHGPVGGPLAAGHGDQPAAADQHRVLAAEPLGVVAVVALRLDQRPQARPTGCGCRLGRGRPGQVARRFAQDEFQLLAGTAAARAPGRRRGVSVVPRITLPSQGTPNSTRPSAVLGTISAWSPGQEFPVHHQVHALAGRHHGLDRPADRLAVLLAELVDPDAGGIDDAARLQVVRRRRFPGPGSSAPPPCRLRGAAPVAAQ